MYVEALNRMQIHLLKVSLGEVILIARTPIYQFCNHGLSSFNSVLNVPLYKSVPLSRNYPIGRLFFNIITTISNLSHSFQTTCGVRAARSPKLYNNTKFNLEISLS